jgi:tetratricopeptide (TPR) repeat protein
MGKPAELLNNLLQINEFRLQNKFELGIALAIQAIEIYGESSELCELIAGLYFSKTTMPGETGDNYIEAIRWINRAIALDNDNSRLHTTLGEYLYIGLLDYEKAISEYRYALAIDQCNRDAYIGLSALYGPPESPVSLEEAINYLKHAIELSKEDPYLHARLGQLLIEQGDMAEAVRSFTRSLMCGKPLDNGYIDLIKSTIIKGE